MLSCSSANALLKSVVAAMATIVVVLLGLSSWDAWQRLAVAGRTTVVAEASAYAFKAMHNLRTDRSTTMRSVNDAETIKPEVADRLKGIREAEMPALASAIEVLEGAAFQDKDTLLPSLKQAVDTLSKLQAETWEAVSKPQADRRAGLADEYKTEATALIELLDKISARLAAAVKQSDPFIGQMLAVARPRLAGAQFRRRRLADRLQRHRRRQGRRGRAAEIRRRAGRRAGRVERPGVPDLRHRIAGRDDDRDGERQEGLLRRRLHQCSVTATSRPCSAV